MIELTKVEAVHINQLNIAAKALDSRILNLRKLHSTQEAKLRKLRDVAINIDILKDAIYRLELKLTELMRVIDLDSFPEN